MFKMLLDIFWWLENLLHKDSVYYLHYTEDGHVKYVQEYIEI